MSRDVQTAVMDIQSGVLDANSAGSGHVSANSQELWTQKCLVDIHAGGSQEELQDLIPGKIHYPGSTLRSDPGV